MSEKATFAAGCFWGVEEAFRKIPGVLDAEVGYIGGHTQNPTYKRVCTGGTGYAEAVQITYDPKQVSYEKLLSVFWNIHDPTTSNRQGPDVGSQYRSVIFYHTAAQKDMAEKSKESLDQSKKFRDPIVTEIVVASEFYRAEEYHQRYFEKNKSHSCPI